MRGALLSLVIVTALAAPVSGSGIADSHVAISSSVSGLQTAQPANSNADTDLNRSARVEWYRSPMRIARAAVVAVIVLFVLGWAIWGGGTTIGDAGYEERISSLQSDERLWQPEPRDKDPEPTLQSRILSHPPQVRR